MRFQSVFLALLIAASASASGFVVGRHCPVRRATDIPTRLEIVQAMAEEVGLDAEQRARVVAISDRHHEALLAVRRKVAGDLAAIRSEVRAETRAVMNEEQQRRFDAYCVRRDTQRARADQ